MKKMKSPYLDNEYIIRSNNMGKAKVVAEGMKKIGNKLVKKRMTAAQRKEMSKDFIKSGQPKGLTDKQFNAKIKKDMSKQKRIDSVKEKNMAASQAKKTILSPKTQARNKTPIKPNKKDDYFNSAEYKKFEAKMLKKIDKGLKDIKPKKLAAGGMAKKLTPVIKKVKLQKIKQKLKNGLPLTSQEKTMLTTAGIPVAVGAGIASAINSGNKTKTAKRAGLPLRKKPLKKADGGMMYKDGGSVSSKRSSKKGVGAAKRGFGKALK